MLHRCYSLATFFWGLILFVACSTPKQVQVMDKQPVVAAPPVSVDSSRTDSMLEDLLGKYPQYFAEVLKNRKNWNVQIIYTQVNTGMKNQVILKKHYFNVNSANYFYPASTVKLPICMLAMQKLKELKDKGVERNTTMITEAGNAAQTAVYNDPTFIDGRPTIAHYIRKILMVSDNDAYNRLYEFLGQEYINSELHNKGYNDVQILHRLNIFLPEEENRRTNPIKFLGDTGQMIYRQPMQYSKVKYAARKDLMGKGYYSGGKLIDGPMDFSKKNRLGLEDLNDMLISLALPVTPDGRARFDIDRDNRDFLLKYMSQYPTESTYPPYSDDTATYFPAYSKFLLFGGQRGSLPKNIRSFSKSGDAYGQMLETSFFVDVENNVAFFLSAAIYCNSDGILNDDKYDYEKIGLPFMKHLGEVIYDMEKKRGKHSALDLRQFIYDYDK